MTGTQRARGSDGRLLRAELRGADLYRTLRTGRPGRAWEPTSPPGPRSPRPPAPPPPSPTRPKRRPLGSRSPAWPGSSKPRATTVSRPIIDGSGNLIWSDVLSDKLLKLAPFGEELTEGSFPVESGVNEGLSSALDAQGNIFATTIGTEEVGNCNTTQPFKLKKLGPGGEELAEGGPVGAESVFAGLSEYATTVAVDQSTGNVYVGIGCQARAQTEAHPERHVFEVEIYGPGGGKLASGIGASSVFKNNGAAGAAFNEIAVNEATKTLYATNGGEPSEGVRVFEDTSAQKTLATSTSGEGGSVQCNMTGNACLSEYDEGQEVIVEATGENFEEWNGGTGSAEACNGSTETSCTFLLEANSSINAAYGAGTPEQPLTLKINEGEGTVVSNPAGIECTRLLGQRMHR